MRVPQRLPDVINVRFPAELLQRMRPGFAGDFAKQRTFDDTEKWQACSFMALGAKVAAFTNFFNWASVTGTDVKSRVERRPNMAAESSIFLSLAAYSFQEMAQRSLMQVTGGYIASFSAM